MPLNMRNAFIASSYEARAAGQGGSILPYVTDLDKARNKVDAAINAFISKWKHSQTEPS